MPTENGGTLSPATATPTSVKSSSASASPSSNASSGSHSNGSINQGEAIGIGIGSAAGGAILASLVFFLLFSYKRRQSQRRRRYTRDDHYHTNSTDKERHSSPTAKNPAGVSIVESHLPQPAEDGKISGEMSRLRDNIKNHTQSYYHSSSVDPAILDRTQLQELAAATGLSAGTLSQLLVDSHSRFATIRLYLSWLILSRCDGRGDPNASILPPEVTLLSDSISRHENLSLEQLVLASKCKSVSAALLQKKYGHKHMQNDARNGSIAQVLTTANSFLSPFILDESEQRMKNLEGIVNRAAHFAYLLFSQPSFWAFNWHGQGTALHQDGMVVFPALLQTVDEASEVITPPRVFFEAEEISISGKRA